MSLKLGFNISFNEFFRLRGVANYAKQKYGITPGAKKTKLESIFNLRIRGSKRFRDIIRFNDMIDQGANSRVEMLERNNIPLVINEARHTDLRKVAFSTIFPNFFKDFFFRLLNNTLLLNYQISKFDQNITPAAHIAEQKPHPLSLKKRALSISLCNVTT